MDEYRNILDKLTGQTIERVEYDPYDNKFTLVVKDGPWIAVVSDGYDNRIMVLIHD